MPDFSVNYFFTDSHEIGWSENYYVSATTIAAALASETVVAGFRLALLAPGNHLDELRVSDVTVFRDSLVQSYAGPAGNGQFPTAASGSNPPVWNRLLLRIEAGSVARRSLEMGGIPAAITDQFGAYTPTATWTKRFNQWVVVMLETPAVELRVRKGMVAIPIQSFVPAANPLYVNLTFNETDVPGGFTLPVKGDTVRLSKMRYTANLNGNWIVYSPPVLATGVYTMSVTGRRLPALVGSLSQPGVWRLIKPSVPFLAITSIQPRRGVARKTGRPFDSPHGRLQTQTGPDRP